MTSQMEERYLAAPRFDESQPYQDEDYSALTTRRIKLAQEMDFLFGPAAVKLLEEYVEAVYDQIETECRYFFEQGCLAVRAGVQAAAHPGAPVNARPNIRTRTNAQPGITPACGAQSGQRVPQPAGQLR